MTAPTAADMLRFTAQPRFTPCLRIVVNGVDLIDSQRPLSPHGRPLLFEAPPCTKVLPPDAVALLPTARPTEALVAVCNCGEAGCNSLWVRVRRAGDRVIWEPDDTSPRRTIDRSWSFDLLAYLDAIDGAVAASHRMETRADTVARELRRRRDSLFGFGMSTPERTFTLGDVYPSWAALDGTTVPCLGIQVAGADGVGEYQVPLSADRTDDDILDELHDFQPERYPNTGLARWIRRLPSRRRGSRRDPVPRRVRVTDQGAPSTDASQS